jgi:N-acetylated-alpha-linked acidic dipeptidase
VLAIMRDIDATLLDETGLPGRGWYKNLSVTTMPGITEAITEERFDDVPKYIGMTAAVLKAYAAKLDQATAAMTQG